MPLSAFFTGKKWILWLAGVAIVFALGWTVNGWRWEAKQDALKLEYAEAREQAIEEAQKRQGIVAAAYNTIDAKRTKEVSDARKSANRLRADLAAGRQRVYVNAACPGVPATPGGAGVDDGGAPRLAGDAEQAFPTLNEQLTRMTAQLRGLQDAERARQSAGK